MIVLKMGISKIRLRLVSNVEIIGRMTKQRELKDNMNYPSGTDKFLIKGRMKREKGE